MAPGGAPLVDEIVSRKNAHHASKTLRAWLRKLDIPIGGKSMVAVRDQAERISAAG